MYVPYSWYLIIKYYNRKKNQALFLTLLINQRGDHGRKKYLYLAQNLDLINLFVKIIKMGVIYTNSLINPYIKKCIVYTVYLVLNIQKKCFYKIQKIVNCCSGDK